MVLSEEAKYTILRNRFKIQENTNGFFQVECEKCGQSITGYVQIINSKVKSLSGIDIIFHHKDGNRENDKLENILVVCYPCHGWGTHLK